MRADQILKNSLLNLYADLPEVVELIHQCDFSKVSRKFTEELFFNIDPDEFYEIDAFLRSEAMKRYSIAVEKATLSCTRDLSELLEFALLQNEGGKIN
jgi:hypothetical protein